MRKLTHKQTIRFKNTLLAALGGAVLTGVVIIAFSQGALFLSGAWLVALIAVFWLVNIGFVLCIYFDLNLRFSDPALSLPQMYWAATVSMGAVAIAHNVEHAVYSLLLLIMVFGVFRVSVKAFHIYSAYVGVGLLIVHGLRIWVFETVESSIELWTSWFTFSFCALGLTALCKSIVKLRNRLREHNEELNHALQAKSYFLANMSHEIRTPMNGVLGMLEIVLREPLNAEQRQYLSIAHSSANGLLNVINDILDFSKIEAGKLTLDPVAVDVEQSTVDVLTTFLARAQQKNLELIIDVAADLPSTLFIDATRFQQILNNLLGNAVKFTERGEIVVSLSFIAEPDNNELGYLVVSVRDSGIGIALEKQKELFEAFTQADASTTRNYGGTGLGLAITKQLCELMGGSIAVNSAPGEGSEFIAQLQTKNIASTEPASVVSFDVSGKSILVVDDNPASLAVIARTLSERGAVVETANSGENALSLLKEKGHYLELAIIDRQMPSMDGEALVKQIRKNSDWNALSILLLSHTLTSTQTAQLKGLRVDACLNKPVAPSKLCQVLDAIFKGETIADEQGPDDGSSAFEFDAITPTKLLLVEDNVTNQQVALLTLEGFGLTADVAENGVECLEMLQKAHAGGHPYPLILMDCQMPVMDGYEAARQIRQLDNDQLSDTPIIAMTANAMKGDREKCLEAGMNDYIAKPINVELLQHSLQYWLDKDRKSAPEDESFLWQEEVEVVKECWDQDALYKLVRFNKDRMVRLVKVFLGDLMPTLNEVTEACTNQDWEELRKSAHALKGSSANLGAKTLPAILVELELEIRDGNVQKIAQIQPRIQQEVQQLHNEMSQFLEAQAAQK